MDNAENCDLLDSAADETRQEELLWSCIEDRRGFWAIRIVLVGLVVKGAGGDWMSHVATAAALLDEYPLAKLPVMRQIAEATLDAFDEQQWSGESFDIEFDEAVSDEAVRGLLEVGGMAEPLPEAARERCGANRRGCHRGQQAGVPVLRLDAIRSAHSARRSISAQSPARTASAGVIHEPPTQATLSSAR